MAMSNHRQSETVNSAADEQWVCLQPDGDTLKELLLNEQYGDERGEKESIQNATDRQDSSEDTEKFFWGCRSAWNDVSVRNALWDDRRPYVLIAALSVYTVLSLLTALVSLAECKSVQFVLTCLRHCTMVILYAAASSCATRFLSLAAVKASALRNPEVEQLLLELLVTKAWILWSVIHSCADHMGAAITFFQEARRQENLVLPLQLLADVARVEALTGAMALTVWLVFLMGADIRASFRAYCRLSKEMLEARRRGAVPWTNPGTLEGPIQHRHMLKWMITYICGSVLFLILSLVSPNRAFPSGHA